MHLLDDLILLGEEILGIVESIDEVVEAVGHIGLEHDVAEERGQREREITLSSQRDVSVARLQTVERQHALSDQLACLFVHADTQARQVWKNYLQET